MISKEKGFKVYGGNLKMTMILLKTIVTSKLMGNFKWSWQYGFSTMGQPTLA